MLDGADGTMVASVDVKNRYNEIMRSAILEVIWDCPDLRVTYLFFHKRLQAHYILVLEAAHTSPQLTSHVARECNK
eukprot:14537717-Ditylum_brightwellii.AAC.1